MKREEFRIGNYAKHIYNNDNQITTISGHDLWHTEHLDDVRHRIEWESLSPIPLTVTWCEKFGGKYHDLNGDVGHYQFKSEIGIIEILHGEDGNFYYNYKLEIKYVHQLQNLFFALTGEELTIK